MSEFLEKVNAELVECQKKLSDEANKSPSDVLKWSFCDDSMKDIKGESKAAQELRQATAWSTPLAECAESVLAELAAVTATLDIERKELAVACEDRDAAVLRADTAEKQLAAATEEVLKIKLERSILEDRLKEALDDRDLKLAERDEARAIIEFFIANPLPSDTLKMERDMLDRARKWLKEGE